MSKNINTIARHAALAGVAATSLLFGCASSKTPVEAYMKRGDHAVELNDYQTAAAEYEKVVERYPGDWRAQYQLGLCYIKLQRAADARRSLEIAHTQRPDDANVADALAESMFMQKDLTRLFAFLNDRAEQSQSVHDWLQIGHYAMKVNDPDTARVAIETAIELDSGMSDVPYLLAASFAEQLGNTRAAIRRLRQAYGIDPRNDVTSERLRALGEIPGPTIALPPGR